MQQGNNGFNLSYTTSPIYQGQQTSSPAGQDILARSLSAGNDNFFGGGAVTPTYFNSGSNAGQQLLAPSNPGPPPAHGQGQVGFAERAIESQQIPENAGGNSGDIVPVTMLVDMLSQQLGLTADYVSDLHSYVQLGKTLPTAALTLHVLTQASIYKLIMLVNPLLSVGPDVMRELKVIRTELETGFKFSEAQKENIRSVVKDITFEPKRSSYTTSYISVMERLKKEADDLGLKNIFGNPSRESMLRSHVRVACSSVRNGFRAEIRDSVFKHKSKLVVFTKKMADRLVWGGSASIITESTSYAKKCAMLRRFAMDNKQLLVSKKKTKKARAEDDNFAGDEESRGDGAEPSEDTVSEASKKRKLDEEVDEDHFWLAVDKYIQAKEAEFGGASWSLPKWREYFVATINNDVTKFGGEKVTATSESATATDGGVSAAPPTPAATMTGGGGALAGIVQMASQRVQSSSQ